MSLTIRASRLAASTLLLVVMGLCARPSVAEPSDEVRLAVGSSPVALDLAQNAQPKKMKLSPVLRLPSSSMAAIEDLLSAKADFALVQRDQLQESEVRIVAPVFQRHLLVFVRRPLHLDAIRDVAGLRVWIGGDADSVLTVGRFLDRVGLPRHRLQRPVSGKEARCRSVPLEDLADCFRSGESDVGILVTTAGRSEVRALLKSGVAELASLDYRSLRLLRSDETPHVFDFSVLHAPGGEGTADVRTLTVPVVLVAARGATVDDETLARLTVGLGVAWNHLAEGEHLAPEATPEPQTVWRLLVGIALAVLALTVAILAIAYLWRSEWSVVRRLRQRTPLVFKALPILILAIVFVTLATYLCEQGVNEHFSNPAESFWSITVYLFSGLEDRSPFTPWGKIWSALGLILGPVLFTLATGWAASSFILWERKMPKHLSDHYLLLNWNRRGLQAVQQVHHPLLTRSQGIAVIVVLSDDPEVHGRLKEQGMGENPFFEDLYVSIGDPTHQRALLNANAQDAHAILVLADERLGAHADERTLRSLFALRRIARDHGRNDLHVVAEIVNPANAAVCEELAADFPGLLEPVVRGEIRSCLLAQATLNGGVVQFYRDLLTVSEETNELYVLPVPPQAVGLRFVDYAAQVLTAHPGAPLIPVGVQRRVDGRLRLLCNPRQGGEPSHLQEGDRLLVLAYEPPHAEDLPRPRPDTASA